MEIRKLSSTERDGLTANYRAAFRPDQAFLEGSPFTGRDPIINCGFDGSTACQARIFPDLIRLSSLSEIVTFYAVNTSAPDDIYEVSGAPDGEIFEKLAAELGPYFDIHFFSTATDWRVCRETLSGFVIYCDGPAAASRMVEKILHDSAIAQEIRDTAAAEAASEPFWRDNSDIIIRRVEG